jgi:hypothetical protein
MKRFFDVTFRPFFVITGLVTALGALNAFWPRWTAEKVELIPFNQDYTIILQHWGFMLGVMGVFMVVAAFYRAWRNPVLIFSACEKGFVVYLIVINFSHMREAFGPEPRWMERLSSTPLFTSSYAGSGTHQSSKGPAPRGRTIRRGWDENLGYRSVDLTPAHNG